MMLRDASLEKASRTVLRFTRPLAGIILAPLILGGCATTQGGPDPLEKFNRGVQKVNDFTDRALLKPVAKGYRKVTPAPVRRAVGNVFGNIGDVGDGVNNILQGKLRLGFGDFARVLINSTIGLGGLFDPAARMGLEDHQEDFGQTLAVWGVPSGPYVVIPFLGPTTVRGMLSRPVDTLIDPLRFLDPVDHRNTLYGARLIDDRSELLVAEEVVFGDRYLFIRDAYLQRRDFLVTDGEVEDPFDDDF